MKERERRPTTTLLIALTFGSCANRELRTKFSYFFVFFILFFLYKLIDIKRSPPVAKATDNCGLRGAKSRDRVGVGMLRWQLVSFVKLLRFPTQQDVVYVIKD